MSTAEIPAVPEELWQPVSKWTSVRRALSVLAIILLWVLVIFVQKLEDKDNLRETLASFIEPIAGYYWLVFAGLAAVVAATALYGYLDWRHRSFAVSDSGVHVRYGVLMKKHKHMRWDRIQKIDVRRRLFDRLTGQGSLAVAPGGIHLENLEIGLLSVAYCQKLRTELLAVVARVRAGQAPQVGDWASRSVENEGEEIYRLSFSRLAGSLIFSLTAVSGLFSVAISIWLYKAAETGGFWAPLIFAITVAINIFRNFARAWGTRVAVTPDGLHTQSGLISYQAQTIPPGRVHAVKLSQPGLWKLFGWWKLELVTADGMNITESASGDPNKSPLIPAGTLDEVLLATWVLMPDLGVPDREVFLREALSGNFQVAGFVPAPRASRWLDPIGWKRSGVALTTRLAVLRHGRWWRRRLILVLHQHYQSLVAKQGPVQRQLGLATLNFAMVSSTFKVEQQNMSLTDVQQLLETENQAGKAARAAANP